MKYKTKSGQMWDEIAFEQLGDCKYVEQLMDANRELLKKYFVFPAGVELEVPTIEAETVKTALPAWY